MEFRPQKRESGLRFGIMWSGVGSVIAVCALASCAYIIPPDNQPPRHNQLLDGGKRRPALNNQVGQVAPTIHQQIQPQYGTDVGVPLVQQAPRAPAGQPAAPIHAPTTPSAQNQAPTNFVTQFPGQQQPVFAPPNAPRAEPNWFERNFPGTAEWLGATSGPGNVGDETSQLQSPIAPIAASAPPASLPANGAPFGAGQPETARALALSEPNPEGTLAPIPESLVAAQQGYQTANNSTYPLLQDTPPVPPHVDEATRKLERARAALEADEREANRARDALQTEVNTGSSLLDEYGYTNPHAPRGADESALRPSHVPSFDEEFGFAPPAPAPDLEPIILRPPQGAPSAVPSGAPKVLKVSGNVSGSAPHITSVSSNSYLPESRYTNRR